MTQFHSFMSDALEVARQGAKLGEVPVGAVIVKDHRVIARAHNELLDGTAIQHAETLAIARACGALGQSRLEGCELYVTLEPCAMCAGAIAHARLRRVYFGASDPKSGGVLYGARVFDHAQTHHKPEVIDGLQADECAALLREFFAAKR